MLNFRPQLLQALCKNTAEQRKLFREMTSVTAIFEKTSEVIVF